MKKIKIVNLRKNLQEAVEGVYYTKEPILVLRRENPRAVIFPLPKDPVELEKQTKGLLMVSKTDIRQNLQDIIDTIFYTGQPIVITRREIPRAIVYPIPKDPELAEKAIEEFQKKADRL